VTGIQFPVSHNPEYNLNLLESKSLNIMLTLVLLVVSKTHFLNILFFFTIKFAGLFIGKGCVVLS